MATKGTSQEGDLGNTKVTFFRRQLNAFGTEIKAINDQGRLVDTDPTQLTLFKVMYGDLRMWYDKVLEIWDSLNERYIEMGKGEELPSDKEKALFQAIKRYYFEAKVSYEKHTVFTPSIPQQPFSSTTFINESKLLRTHLPQISIPNFNGDLGSWPKFKDTFISLVHNDSSITPIEKFHFLLTALEGEARTLLTKFEISEANYDLAWKALLEAYNNERMLATFHINKILDFNSSHLKSPIEAAQAFLINVADNIEALKRIDIPNLGDFLLAFLGLRSLDSNLREQFELANTNVKFPTSDSVINFVRKRHTALKIAQQSKLLDGSKVKPNNYSHQHLSRPRMRSAFLANKEQKYTSSSFHNSKAQAKVNYVKCFVCDGIHSIMSCPQVLKATPDERQQLFTTWRGCRNCLKMGHNTIDCPSKWSCRICKKRHHSLLHTFNTNEQKQQKSSSTNLDNSLVSALGSTTPQDTEVLLGTARAVIRDKFGHYKPVRLVIDCGSQLSFISEECVRKLNLPTHRFNKKITGIGQAKLTGVTKAVSCSILSQGITSAEVRTTAVVLPNITNCLPSNVISPKLRNSYLSYRLADVEFWKPQPVDILLGCDVFSKIITGSPIVLSDNQPALIPSIFGYIIMGTIATESTESSYKSFLVNSVSDIQESLSQFWQIEEPHPIDKTYPEDEYCESQFRSSHYRQDDGRYVVGLPFRMSPVSLGDSKPAAVSRLLSLESKLFKNPSLRHDYDAFMREYISLGHMQIATQPAKYYIPHHCVLKPDSCSTKLRVVFDGSSKTATGSLNDFLLPGPKLQQDICYILLNFRIFSVVFIADLIKMYRQILVRTEDQPFQHILWRFSQEEPIQEYSLSTVTYGLNCSPYLALRTLKQLVNDEGSKFPLAANKILSDMYVDDLVTGTTTLEEAKKLIPQLTSLFKCGGFTLSKWATNKPELANIMKDQVSTEPITIRSDEDSSVKVLGLQWDPQSDVFMYKVFRPESTSVTKRCILSYIARIYDPLGYLSPLIFLAKCILQQLWKAKLDWDDPVPQQMQQQWIRFTAGLDCLTEFRLCRHLNTEPNSICHIIGFSDASELGYSACIYLRTYSTSNPEQVTSSLIKAKTKLAPVKSLTIPRLELCGALLLARLYTSISWLHDKLNIQGVTFYVDSALVLGWLNTPIYTLKTFVANRINTILELTQLESWHHVSTVDNPADCASRGLDAKQLVHHCLWWSGPQWLLQPLPEWPVSHVDVPAEVPEIKSKVLLSTSSPPEFIVWFTKFSSLISLIRTMSYILRFTSTLRKGHQSFKGYISAAEFNTSLQCCIRLQQSHSFHANLKDDSIVSDKSLAALNPFLDSSGLIRVGGRLTNSSLPPESKFPLLLPSNCHLSTLIVDYYHQEFHHPGPSLLMALIRGKYWIPSLRRLVRSRNFKCLRCYKANAKPIMPYMGNLPPSRFHEGRAFCHVGMDFAGPFIIRDSLRRKANVSKCYLCLFICMSTKAVHLEAVTALTTEAFLATLDRFISRRGMPEHLYSDCGTNFVGAHRHLQEMFKFLNRTDFNDKLTRHLAPKGITWSFNPPYAPHFGGIWEAGVKSVKTLLNKILADHPCTYEELSTIFCRIESILNSRPLCPLTESPEDYDYLTPGHFLIGSSLKALPEKSLLDIKDNRLSRWELVQSRIQHYWHRWKYEYLNTLQQRRKWIQQHSNLSKGDLVLLTDSSTSPGAWPTARIVDTHPGPDGVVRVVTIKTSKGLIFKRPVVKVVPLQPLNDSLQPEGALTTPIRSRGPNENPKI